MTQLFITVTSTTIATPGDWSNTNNKIEVIGSGAAGVGRQVANTRGGAGGGGGAYTRQVNVTLTAGNATVTVATANNGATCSYAKGIPDSVNIAANSAGVNSAIGGAAGTGNTANFRGGNGFTPAPGNATGGSGGGAAGPNGPGGDATISAAGSADGGTVAPTPSAGTGNSGTEFDSTHGCGTGAFGQNGNGFAGGKYGGGGSGHGANATGTAGCAGADGLVVRTYFADQTLTQPTTYSDSGEALFAPTTRGPDQSFASFLTADDGFTILTADDGITALTVPWIPLFNEQPGLAFIDADVFFTAVLGPPLDQAFASPLTADDGFTVLTADDGVTILTVPWLPLFNDQPGLAFIDADTFFTASLAFAFTQTLAQPATYTDVGEAFFGHALTTPTNLVQPAVYVDTGEAFFGAALAPGLVALSQSTLYNDTAEAFFSPALLSINALTASLYNDAGEAFFAHGLLSLSALSQATVYVDVGEIIFAPSVTSSVFAATTGIVEFLATDGIALPAFLENTASQTLTIPGWTEFRNVVPSLVPGPIEAQATQIAAAAGPAEFLAGFSTDRPGFVENQASQLSGASTWTEFLATQSAAEFAPIEFQTSQSQVSPGPSEFLNSVITDRPALLENQASQILGGPAWVEFQTVFPALTVPAPTEFQATQSVASAGPLEFSATQQISPFASVEWLTVSIMGSGVAQLEATALQALAIPALLEFLNTPFTPGQHSDSPSAIEFQGLLAATMPAAAEWLANWRVDAVAPLEALPTVPRLVSLPTEFGASVALPNLPLPLEFGARLQVIGSPLIEAASLLSQDQRAFAEWLAGVLLPGSPFPVEFGSPMLFTDASAPLEFGGSLFLVTEQMPLEWLRVLSATDRTVPLEWDANISSGVASAPLEWLAAAALIQQSVPLEALAAALNTSPAVFEWLGTHRFIGGGMAPIPIEFGTVLSAVIGLSNAEFLAGVASDPDLGAPIEWLRLRPPPVPNLRPGRLRTGGTFNRPAPFSAIDIGETDNFAFDFSNEVGGATIVSTSWTCRVAPFQTIVDLVPQSHVLSAGAYRLVSIRSVVGGVLIIKSGAFSVASLGAFGLSSMGGTYILEATVNLSNGRILQLSASVRCKGRNDG